MIGFALKRDEAYEINGRIFSPEGNPQVNRKFYSKEIKYARKM